MTKKERENPAALRLVQTALAGGSACPQPGTALMCFPPPPLPWSSPNGSQDRAVENTRCTQPWTTSDRSCPHLPYLVVGHRSDRATCIPGSRPESPLGNVGESFSSCCQLPIRRRRTLLFKVLLARLAFGHAGIAPVIFPDPLTELPLFGRERFPPLDLALATTPFHDFQSCFFLHHPRLVPALPLGLNEGSECCSFMLDSDSNSSEHTKAGTGLNRCAFCRVPPSI